MIFSSVFVAALAAFGLSVTASPSPSPARVIHGTRTEHADWAKDGAPQPDAVVPVGIGLLQRNLERGPDWLLDVSDPKSKNYGKHWSPDQVAETFASSPGTVKRVESWLASSAITTYRKSPGWIRFESTVRDLEALLQTRYFYLKHNHTGARLLACDTYSVPSHLSVDIDLVLPSIHMNHLHKMSPRQRRASPDSTLQPQDSPPSGLPTTKPNPIIKGPAPQPQDVVQDSYTSALKTCWSTYRNHGSITPDCIRSLYNYMPNFVAHPKNTFYIPEFRLRSTQESYVASDLDNFFTQYAPQLKGQRPIFNSVGGGTLDSPTDSHLDSVESNLDFSLSMPIVYPQQVSLLQTIGSFDDLIDAFDGSFCTYDGGNNATYDYGYTACGSLDRPKVMSVSYGIDERYISEQYATRQCNEWLKLGLLGTSVLFSSGDYGVGGNNGYCAPNGAFTTSFPATCPWLTAVGATKLAQQPVGTNLAESATSEFSSGGGFSNLYSQPAYQKNAVNAYLANHGSSYSSANFNASNRAYPDVSAMGQDIIIPYKGAFYYSGGTSASSPIFASLLTLINQQRLKAHKSTVGFINPALYQNPGILTDITSGSNPACGGPGFPADQGWDPVTGLGTPNFPKMLEFFMGLK